MFVLLVFCLMCGFDYSVVPLAQRSSDLSVLYFLYRHSTASTTSTADNYHACLAQKKTYLELVDLQHKTLLVIKRSTF